jgi:hypothetical protein
MNTSVDRYGGWGWSPSAGYYEYWWNAPAGMSDLDLYDYNNNFVLDDNEIEDLVRDNIAEDPGIPTSDIKNINVEVKDGVVKLSGEVRNPRTKPMAYVDAWWSSGVLDVENKIDIKPFKRKDREAGQSKDTRANR